jgi:predicted acyltransferase
MRLCAVFGKNPLALYMLAEVLMAAAWTVKWGHESLFMAIFTSVFAGQETGWLGSFAFGLAMVGLCWAVGMWLDRRRIYIRL